MYDTTITVERAHKEREAFLNKQEEKRKEHHKTTGSNNPSIGGCDRIAHKAAREVLGFTMPTIARLLKEGAVALDVGVSNTNWGIILYHH